MNEDELKKLWQQQPLREPSPSPAQLISAMQNKTSRLRRCLNARDLRELLACGVVIIVFGIYAYFERTPVVRLGWLMVIGSATFIAGKLVYARWASPPAPPGETIIATLRAELNAVRTQSRLLGSVLWWYLLPPLIGLLVATWGMPISLVFKIPATVFYVALYAFIYVLNQRARSTQLIPLEEQLQSLLHSAETGEPLDETHMADLRPIALSMADVDQAKPVEFRVAFWQVALWGEIGFMGIWFFLILGLTWSHDAGTTYESPPEAPVQPPSARETARDALVAHNVVDLLNAHDYDSVQRLFNTNMSDALPPEQATEFFTRLTARFGTIATCEGPLGGGYRGWPLFRLHGQHGELTMSLALDTDGRISGIYFQPERPRPPSKESFVRRFFTPLHLALMVPFFLAGLLYSKLIQKTTERAVGISTLGVHLRKGHDFVLWDEIKEVRPFTFLHIRNLWLIKHSGERTPMHWTPLERHADLKAAVEDCAPPNHPIRDYLSLLRP